MLVWVWVERGNEYGQYSKSQDFILLLKECLKKLTNCFSLPRSDSQFKSLYCPWFILQGVLLIITVHLLLCVCFISFGGTDTKNRDLVCKQRVCRQRLAQDVSFFSNQTGGGLCVISALSAWLKPGHHWLLQGCVTCLWHATIHLCQGKRTPGFGELYSEHTGKSAQLEGKNREIDVYNFWERGGRLNSRKWEGGLWSDKLCVRGEGAS